MANSKFEYVKAFEQEEQLLPDVYIVVRVDGRNFHRFAEVHRFRRPTDDRGVRLMSRCALHVMEEVRDVTMAMGMSDEFSFAFKRNTEMYTRRASKLISVVVSCFASSFVFFWRDFFPDEPLQYPPVFDGRVALYPTRRALRDYFSWRQVDCHINNMYNYCLTLLMERKALAAPEATALLNKQYRTSGQKHELLFAEFAVNYSHLPASHRRGTVLVRAAAEVRRLWPHCAVCCVCIEFRAVQAAARATEGAVGGPGAATSGGGGNSDGGAAAASGPAVAAASGAVSADAHGVLTLHDDIIGDAFWRQFPQVLERASVAAARAQRKGKRAPAPPAQPQGRAGTAGAATAAAAAATAAEAAGAREREAEDSDD